MIDKVSVAECSLCGSCVSACPTGAISYTKKHLGFSYPQIDLKKCVDCGKCEQVCPALHSIVKREVGFPISYAACSLEKTIRLRSTSGGVFYEIAKQTIERGGFACGASFDDNMQVTHIIVNDLHQLQKLCGSKYVQSDMQDTYRKIKNFLADGRSGVFCGCPCQVAALRTYLGEKHEKLLLIDLICHGIPGPDVFHAYLNLQERRHHARAVQVSFRNKEKGWHNSSVRIDFSNGRSYSEPITEDAYMKGFLESIVLKENCFQCRYLNGNSGSDLTLGDFWGAEVILPDLDDNTGLSAVIANSSKGLSVLEQLPLFKQECPFDVIEKYNRNAIQPSGKSEKREEFWGYADKNGLEKAIQDMLWEKRTHKIKRKIRYRLRCVYYRLLRRERPLY